MNIPTSFRVAHRTWRVRFKRMNHNHGKTDFNRGVITIDAGLRGNRELLEHTWLHELLHACAGTMGWQRVNRDEDRIDALAALLVQALNTSSGVIDAHKP